ncbi:MAG: DUF255 domain-containing protein, partial [Ignavibacteriae bacterium]|nr:DUF255 domain-containing protein [Ignavibacteriota bacterium]
MRLSVLFVGMWLVLLTIVSPAGEKEDLKWRTFNQGVNEAKKKQKKVLIDVYTDWCGWCKRMDVQTYADKSVASYLNEKYVVIKLNAESNKKLSYKGNEYTEAELSAA